MERDAFDPGLTRQYEAPLRRVINKDGSFNVRRQGGSWHDPHLYLHLVNMSWPWFLTTLFLGFLVVNTLFALAYFSLGPGQLAGEVATTRFGHFLNAMFFSAHTLSTVGYGNMAPASVAANVFSSLEAMLGLMGFAMATSLLYGRFSRPSACIGFSPQILVAPYRGGAGLQFRIVNQRANQLMEVEAKVMLMTVEGPPGALKRSYHALSLERSAVQFLPLTWTVVHPIDDSSPLAGKAAADLERLQAEFLILIKGFDDTFSQVVHSRFSYRFDEVLWGRRFAPAFHVDERGDMVLAIDKVGAIAPVKEQPEVA